MAKARTTGSPSRYGQAGSAEEQANLANLKRETEIRALLDKVVNIYSPGGEFGKGTEAMLERQKTQYLGSATQSLISSGLYGSTMTAGLPKKFEEEVGMPTRAKLEDIRMGKYTGALGQKAGFIEGIEDRAPDLGLMASLQQQASAKPQESLSSWLAQNFGTVPSAQSTPSTTRTAMAADDERRRKALTKLRSQYGTTGAA